ncbi:MAG: helix-turn-helix domain-containing protein [Candidatus Ornithomonoglobus sp.]
MTTKRQFISDDFAISQEETDSGWTMPYSHYHAAYEIYILKTGERTVITDGVEYSVKAGDAALFSSGISHRSRGDVPFSGICIHFSERYLDFYFNAEAKRLLMRCFKNNVISLNDGDFSIIKYIADTFDKSASDNFLKLAAVLNILNRSDTSADIGTSVINEKKIKKSQRIIEYVNENYVYIKRISDITELFDVSENYVFQVLRKKYNMTPKQYINKLRINNACHRLKYSDKSIKSIAHNCGFDTYEYFTNVFKKTVGCTPTEYRKKKNRENNTC